MNKNDLHIFNVKIFTSTTIPKNILRHRDRIKSKRRQFLVHDFNIQIKTSILWFFRWRLGMFHHQPSPQTQPKFLNLEISLDWTNEIDFVSDSAIVSNRQSSFVDTSTLFRFNFHSVSHLQNDINDVWNQTKLKGKFWFKHKVNCSPRHVQEI